MIAVTVLLCAGILVFWRFAMQPAPPQQTEAGPRLDQGVYISDSRLVGRRDGKRQWEITSARVRDDGDNVDLLEISEVVIFQDNEPYFTVYAEQGRWHRPTNNLELMGNVSATGPDDFALTTTRLFWEAGTEVLRAPEPLVVHYRGAEAQAETMVAETKVELVRLTGNVLISQDGMIWQMEEIVYDMANDLMHVYGSATLQVEKGSGE